MLYSCTHMETVVVKGLTVAVDDDDDVLLLLCQSQAQQPQHREFHVVHETHSGRQLLESAEDTASGGTGRLICNITGTLLLFVENITLLTDGKPIPVAMDQMSCTARDCNSNSTVYVISAS